MKTACPLVLFLLLLACQEPGNKKAEKPEKQNQPVTSISDSVPPDSLLTPEPVTAKKIARKHNGKADLPPQFVLSDTNVCFSSREAEIRSKLKVEVISAKEFYDAPAWDPQVIEKRPHLADSTENGLIISLGNGKTKTYTNRPVDSDTMIDYTYLGHIDFLNAYLLSAEYWEFGACFLFNAEDGSQIVQLAGMPSISPDRKTLFSTYTNPYYLSEDLQYYSINEKGELKEELKADFLRWMVAHEPSESLWSSDSTFLLKVRHPKEYWNNQGQFSHRNQYLKFTLKP